MSVLGRLDSETFLRDYWQKKPCLIRQAYPELKGFIDGDELAGLSCEVGLESRLVIEKDGPSPWQVLQGPFRADSFKKLPPSHWTLLVQGVERVLPHAASLLDDFRFLPNWRLDDVMISYGPDQSSVGPHFDSYDVFLIQGAGSKKWLIATEAWTKNDNECLPGLDLKILKTFKPTTEWVLEPGDMIYLPPNFAHHGIAIGSAITYSVGFRAPHHRDVLLGFASHAAKQIEGDWRYDDPDLKLQQHPGEIAASTFERLEQILMTYIKDSDALRDWFGAHVTEPKNDAIVRRPDEPYEEADVKQRLVAGEALVRTEGGRIAYATNQAGNIGLFADGQRYELNASAIEFAMLLSEEKRFTNTDVQKFMANKAARACLLNLVNEGFLYFPSDWEEE